MKPSIKLYAKRKNNLLNKRISDTLCLGILIGAGIGIGAVAIIIAVLKFIY